MTVARLGKSSMDFNAYQERANKTAIYPEEYKLTYPTLGLAGEAGEVAEKVKKIVRDGKDIKKEAHEIAKELGDVLWYVAAVARDINYSLQVIAAMNIQKLESRKERGVLQGNGDNR
jgi:NTP pyrophosphatase (non-canonical NTP hydrolase)